jgi:hypothetical protein
MGESFREPVRALGYWALDNLAEIDAAREQYDVREKKEGWLANLGHWIV